MKLEKISFDNHKIFKNMEIKITDNNENILNTIVLIGENGVGKSTLLKEIYKIFNFKNAFLKELVIENDWAEITCNSATIKVVGTDDELMAIKKLWNEEEKNNIINRETKVVYMPTEINFEKLNKVDNTFKFTSSFVNTIDQNITRNVPSFIATKINKEIFKNRDKTIGEVIDRICDDINGIFDYMDMDVKLIGLSEDENTVPIFKNKLEKEFDINGLSSGEKQLFLRALSLKFLEVNNSVILIDEPEISLHPKWQKKIIKVYENIGENNQIIMATHSPHIVADIEAKQLRIMKKDNDGIAVINGDDVDETYGQNVETILKGIMGIDNVRNDDISDKLLKIYELLEKNLFDTKVYKDIFEYLRKYLGDLDKDIMRIRLEESVRRKKTDVKDK